MICFRFYIFTAKLIGHRNFFSDVTSLGSSWLNTNQKSVFVAYDLYTGVVDVTYRSKSICAQTGTWIDLALNTSERNKLLSLYKPLYWTKNLDNISFLWLSHSELTSIFTLIMLRSVRLEVTIKDLSLWVSNHTKNLLFHSSTVKSEN